MIKILFIDTSALLSFFISDKGTATMRWLMSSDNKKYDATRFVLNNQVINEFESELVQLVKQNEIKETTANNILNLFNANYRNKIFKVVGKNASVKGTLDGMYNFMGRISRPMLVTSNNQQMTNAQEYRTINPKTQNPKEIELVLRGKKPKFEECGEINLCKRIFKKTRMAIPL